MTSKVLECQHIENQESNTLEISEEFFIGTTGDHTAMCTKIDEKTILIKSQFENTTDPLVAHGKMSYGKKKSALMNIAATEANLKIVCNRLGFTHYKGKVGRSVLMNVKLELESLSISSTYAGNLNDSWISITCTTPGIDIYQLKYVLFC